MKRLETAHPDVWEVQPNVFRDARGFLTETYHQQKFYELGISVVFVQDNHSRSIKGTLRGLHYQLNHPQAKLCRVVEGEALDIAVDVRLGSPNFGKWGNIILSAEKQNEMYIPAGFAHGSLALSETVQFLYKCSDFYDPYDEHGIIWNDPRLAIAWGISNPLVSMKDAAYPPLSMLSEEFLPRYEK